MSSAVAFILAIRSLYIVIGDKSRPTLANHDRSKWTVLLLVERTSRIRGHVSIASSCTRRLPTLDRSRRTCFQHATADVSHSSLPDGNFKDRLAYRLKYLTSFDTLYSGRNLGSWFCKFCATEYNIHVRPAPNGGYANVVVEIWQNLGTGRSPCDSKCMRTMYFASELRQSARPEAGVVL